MVGGWQCSAAVVRCVGPGGAAAALPGRSVQIVTRAFVPAAITFPTEAGWGLNTSPGEGQIVRSQESYRIVGLWNYFTYLKD